MDVRGSKLCDLKSFQEVRFRFVMFSLRYPYTENYSGMQQVEYWKNNWINIFYLKKLGYQGRIQTENDSVQTLWAPKKYSQKWRREKEIVAKYTRPPGEKAHALVFYYVFSDCISFDPNYRFMTLFIWLYILFKPV